MRITASLTILIMACGSMAILHARGLDEVNGRPALVVTASNHTIYTPELRFSPVFADKGPGKGEEVWKVSDKYKFVASIPIDSVDRVSVLGRADDAIEMRRNVRLATVDGKTFEGMSYNGSTVSISLPDTILVDGIHFPGESFIEMIDQFIPQIPVAWGKSFEPRRWCVNGVRHYQIYLIQIKSIEFSIPEGYIPLLPDTE